MAERLTKQQLQAVTDRGGDLLVSAAAGSGKTKVLVDRLMGYLMDPVDPANLDEFLIITYTKAAAAELRGKIGAKLSEHIAMNPGNRHLQQQMQRLYLAKISTVHAFCTDILREHAHRLDLSADFRVLDENECVELQTRIMQQVLDEMYANTKDNSDFFALVDTQGFGRDDRQIPEIVFQVYNSAKCHLNPDKWLDWCLQVNDVNDVADAAQTIWGKYLIKDLQDCLDLHIDAMNKCVVKAAASEGMEKPTALLKETVVQLQMLHQCTTWDAVCARKNIDYGRLTFGKSCTDLELVEQIKAVRDACKSTLAKKLRSFSDSSDQILSDIQDSAAAMRGLISLVKKFSETYDKFKRSRRVLDFADLEHKTLDLLCDRGRTNRSKVAKEIGQRFREVMVDEYQDSNVVQDAIFSALTKDKHNCFMVGDVKQSIYQFRLADPGIFLQKYNTFNDAESAVAGQGRKVLLSNNFRSAGGVIDAVNDVFSACMSVPVGGLEYGEAESLHEGIPHTKIDDQEIELYGVTVQNDTYAEEAAFVAKRVRQLIDGTHMIRDGEHLRPITPGDIAILLRSPGSVGGEYKYALEQCGIRCVTGSSADLLHTEEIETLRAFLQVINNPMQDIPLIGVLTSRLFCFTADDMALIRGAHRHGSMFSALQASDLPKAKDFLATLTSLREEARLTTLPQLISRLYTQTRIDSIFGVLPEGMERIENLHAFCQFVDSFHSANSGDLGAFLAHLDAIEERGLISGDRGGDVDAVTIMSIHKSKGLEFPVVFLCGLSREFNNDSARAQVLCDKELGLGLSCVDSKNRVRYPSVAKRAIAAKMIADGVSEEMRVLYVAMTRAKDRLIMTYASKKLEKDLASIVQRADISNPLLLTAGVDRPGKWVLYAALKRKEALEFFNLSGTPAETYFSNTPWKIRVVIATENSQSAIEEDATEIENLPEQTIAYIRDNLAFQYPYILATTAPSKQTATQLKGRKKDAESAEFTKAQHSAKGRWRKPSFADRKIKGKDYGNALHAVLEHIRYEACDDVSSIRNEVNRLVAEEYISKEQGEIVDVQKIADFFSTEIGRKLRTSEHVLREFKFSILDDGERYCQGMTGEKVLLQGVVDCAIIEPDGITLIDFKSDRVNEDSVETAVDGYRHQIDAYANALERIYCRPVKTALLYFFSIRKFVEIHE